MTLSMLLSVAVWVGSDEQVTALRQAARDHAWEGPAIVDPEFAADAVMANVEARDENGDAVEASKEALEVYRCALVDSAEQAMVKHVEPLYVVCVDRGSRPRLGSDFAFYSRGEIERAPDAILAVHRRSVSASTRLAFREATVDERKTFEGRELLGS